MSENMIQMITDRTAADASRARELSLKVSAGTATDSESAEWAADLKGTYNASDLNRVGRALAYVAGRLNGAGYAVDVAPKTDWAEGDIPTASQLRRYVDDVAAVRAALAVFASTPAAPKSPDGLTWQMANNIEQILIDVDRLLDLMAAAWFHSGDLYAGEI